jgi:hypothetical protein
MKRYQNYQKKVILMMMIMKIYIAKVKPVIIEHYYDVDEDREDGIYTRLLYKINIMQR